MSNQDNHSRIFILGAQAASSLPLQTAILRISANIVIPELFLISRHPDETKRPRFSQIKYCLAQNDDRLLGREKNQDRQRSSSLNELALETITEETDGLQYTYCKTN